MTEHIVAVFETEMAAQAANDSLRSAGIPSSAIRQYTVSGGGGGGGGHVAPTEHASTQASGGGFWSWLFGEDSTTNTTHIATTDDLYDRRASAGNVVVSVTVEDDSKIHDAITALEAHHPVDIDERSDESDEAGGGSMATAPMPGASTTGRDFSSSDVAQSDMTPTPSGERAGTGGTPLFAPSATTSGTSETSSAVQASRAAPQGEQVIPLSEEQLDVGKRTVDRGTTRIRRYVVEKPVEESITLHEDRVTVERRQPAGTTATPEAGAFEERVVEVHETAEEPVVAKSAHVVEEVVIGRETTERTETVRDTVRREEIEVTDNTGVKR